MHRSIICLASILGAAGLAQAADIFVPNDFATIQDAIDAAMPGDRVLVSAGTYAEQIDFLGKSISVEGPDGAGVTIIDGENRVGYVVTVASGETDSVLRGFTITGGFGEAGSFGAGPGGGMLVQNASLRIEDSVFVANAGIQGGGVQAISADVLVRNTRFEDNDALDGGGLYIQFGTLTAENCEFRGNYASNNGGGLAVFWGTEATITDSVFTENGGNGLGAGLYANHATLNASRLEMSRNGSIELVDDDPGGGIIYYTFGGGAIYTSNTNGRIDSSRLIDNRAFAGSGVYVAGSGTLELVNLLLAEHEFNNLGVIYANGSSPVVANSTLQNNERFNIFTTFNAFPTVSNSVLSTPDGVGDTNAGGNGVTTINYSVIDGSYFSAELGPGVIFGSPLLDPDADYAPLAGSPVIDAGDNSAVPGGVVADLLGNDRFFDDPDTADTGNGEAPLVDIGAIEFGAPPFEGGLRGDMNGDGTVDLTDLGVLLAAWGPCDDCGDCLADMTGDCMVGLDDLGILLGNLN
jgi:hypothetical protein